MHFQRYSEVGVSWSVISNVGILMLQVQVQSFISSFTAWT